MNADKNSRKLQFRPFEICNVTGNPKPSTLDSSSSSSLSLSWTSSKSSSWNSSRSHNRERSGDRKSWDPRKLHHPDDIYPHGSTLVSWVLAWMLSRCVIKWWELRDSLSDFSQRWQRIRQGIRTRALVCSFMQWANGKGEFFRVENKASISRCEWITSASASCTRKLLDLFCKVM